MLVLQCYMHMQSTLVNSCLASAITSITAIYVVKIDKPAHACGPVKSYSMQLLSM